MSDRPLSPDTAAALRRLTNRVTVSADVEPVIREELAGHLEDKLLDYTSGRLRPSEADALLLVERHLGDPGPLSDRLARAYGRLVPPSLVDRLLTLVTATAAVFAGVDGLIAVVDRVLPGLTHTDARTAGAALDAIHRVHPIVTPALLWAWLAIVRDRAPWSRRTRVLWAAMACVACVATPVVRAPSFVPVIGRPFWLAQLERAAVRPYGLFGTLAVGAAWLWWTTRGRPWRSVAPVAMLAWIAATTAADVVRPHWSLVSYGSVWQLQGPSLGWAIAYGTGDACTLLSMVSLLLATRLIWDRLAHPSRSRPLAAD